MNIQQIYTNFQTPKNLQEHMLRVASLAEIIIKNWTGEEINGEAIIQACLMHDIAKPMHFDLAKQPQFGMLQVDIKKLAELQKCLTTNYSPNEHEAAVKICQEVGCSPEAVKLVDNLEWEYIPRLLSSNDLESLIPIYCDMRIAPNGIMPLQERIDDLKSRHYGPGDLDELKEDGLRLEKVLQENMGVDLNGIGDGEVEEETRPPLLPNPSPRKNLHKKTYQPRRT